MKSHRMSTVKRGYFDRFLTYLLLWKGNYTLKNLISYVIVTIDALIVFIEKKYFGRTPFTFFLLIFLVSKLLRIGG